jgi:hypothetical protein
MTRFRYQWVTSCRFEPGHSHNLNGIKTDGRVAVRSPRVRDDTVMSGKHRHESRRRRTAGIADPYAVRLRLLREASTHGARPSSLGNGQSQGLCRFEPLALPGAWRIRVVAMFRIWIPRRAWAWARTERRRGSVSRFREGARPGDVSSSTRTRIAVFRSSSAPE